MRQMLCETVVLWVESVGERVVQVAVSVETRCLNEEFEAMSGHQQADNQRFDIERARIPQLADDLRRRWGSIDVAPDIRDRLCAKHMRKHVEQNDEPSGGPWDVVIGMRSDGHMVQTAPELRDSWSCGEKVVDAELKKNLGSL